MKLAFTVTGPDLAEALSRIARGVSRTESPLNDRRRRAPSSTISPQARQALAAETEGDDADLS